VSGKLTPRELSVLYSLWYLEGEDEYQRGAWISYTRLSDGYDKTIWHHRQTLDKALIRLGRLRLITLKRPVKSVTAVQLTKAGRRIAQRVHPFVAALWIGKGLVKRPL